MTFTPVHTALGGLLLHISTSTLLSDTGRVLGISGITDGAVLGLSEAWRWSVITGLLSGPVVAHLTGLSRLYIDQGSAAWSSIAPGRLALAGLLVGFGAKLGSGCTSGHFLCGVSRLSKRSIVATATFFATALITANLFPLAVPSDLPSPTSTLDIVPSLGLAVAAIIFSHRTLRIILRRTISVPKSVRLIPFYTAGLTFSLGLSISGMISPYKVVSFLRVLPPWTAFDPSLAVIVLTGVVPNALHFMRVKAKQSSDGTVSPKYPWESWQIPTSTQIDWSLLSGAAIFGVGWGLSGVCPGPAIVSLGQILVEGISRDVSVAMLGWISFGLPMLAGMQLVRTLL